MKYSLIALAGLTAATLFAADAKVELKDQKDKAAYALGLNIGKNWKRQMIDVNLDTVMKGVRDGLEDKATMTDQEIREVMNAFQTEIRAKQDARRKEDAVKNKAEGDKFLAENAKKPGIKTTASGMQYKVLKEGTGPIPSTNDTVQTHYRGRLINGKEFDSSYKRGNEPVKFQANRVIKGWTEALSMMKVGSKWEVYLPPDLAYGERGAGGDIGPNATLIFEVELVGIEPPAKPAEPITSDIIKVPSAEELKAGAKIEVIKPGSTNK